MKRIMVQVPDDLLAELNRAAKETDVSRAAFARRAIELALAERRRGRDYRAIIRSFETTPDEDLTVSKARIRQAWPG